jgi:asparaginyl-tRNA synthetase
MNITLISDIYKDYITRLDKELTVEGWVRTVRSSKSFGFIELNDGSCFDNLQIVFTDALPNFSDAEKYPLGSSLSITGTLVRSAGKGQEFELQAARIDPVGLSSLDNPIQKKRHTFEYLRTIPHLRPRTNTFKAVFRVRSLLAFAIHKFFKVTTLDMDKLPLNEKHEVDYSQELLGANTHLTVSGQLAVEPFCMAFRNVYTFGPTFRAENSNTPRHANEFWMIEPEIAFGQLEEDMRLAEDMVKYLISYVLENAQSEMKFFNSFVDNKLLERLESIVKAEFGAITYTEAIDLLKKSNKTFEYPTDWGENLQTEHERYLSEEVFKKPVFVVDYPKDIKAFYMKLNGDNKTVRAMDLLVPDVGEIIGGSQREDNLEILEKRMRELKMSVEEYAWYLDVRKFGTFPHAGFGLGFERAVMYLTGMKNIRDVIPYPRTPNNAIF